jgi:hypothetical protein
MKRSLLLSCVLATASLLASCADNRVNNAAAITSSGGSAIHGTFKHTGGASTITLWPEAINGVVSSKPSGRADQGAFPVKAGINRILIRVDTTQFVGIARYGVSRTVVDFSARQGTRYAINGDWTSEGLFVWIEEGDSGKIISPKKAVPVAN